MGYMNEFPHSRMFDSDLREILELFKNVQAIPGEMVEFKREILSKYGTLENFVKTYLENLDVQEEINNKLETMYLEGKLVLPYVTPQMFGAKGDGIHNDTEAFKEMLLHGTNIYIPKGKYIISETLTIRNSTMYIIRGESRASTELHYTGNENTFLVDIRGTQDIRYFCEFHQIKFTGENNNSGISMAYNSDKFKLCDVELNNFKFGIHSEHNWNHSFYDCVIMNCDVGFWGANINAINFINLIAMFCRINISITTARNINFIGGDYSAGSECCIYLYYVLGCGIYSPYIEKANSVGIKLLACNAIVINGANNSVFYENTTLLEVNNCRGVKITGFNTETGIGSTTTVGNSIAIKIEDSVGVNVETCEISNVDFGIYIKGCKGSCNNNIFNYTNVPYKLEQHNYVFYDFSMRLEDFVKSIIGICVNTCKFRFTDVSHNYTIFSEIPQINCNGYNLLYNGKPLWRKDNKWIDASGIEVNGD